MKMKSQRYSPVFLWVTALIGIGSILGFLTQPAMSTWYSALKRSPLTPPNYVFPVAWTVLYALLGVCGGIIWQASSVSRVHPIKSLYIIQLILNWMWTPVFFQYHLTGLALLLLILMDILTLMVVYVSYAKQRSVSLLMSPYLGWILFASYLNFYIWLYN